MHPSLMPALSALPHAQEGQDSTGTQAERKLVKSAPHSLDMGAAPACPRLPLPGTGLAGAGTQ